eukprot:jgi/Psemu1/258454/estExt_Genewise1Plus.C_2860017
MVVSTVFHKTFALLLLIVQGSVLWEPLFVAADPNFDFGGGEPKFCRPFTCGKGKQPVQKWPLSFKSSGCSSLGMGIAMSSPGNNNEIHEGCCDQRAACLQTCGAIKTVCDEEFQKCTEDVCANSDDEEQCKKSASVFSIMINFGNCQTYDTEQYSHCDCVASEDAPGRREDLLQKFYTKFSPDSVDKARDLAKKADTPRKMANLMGKLVKKYYPKTIRKIKDPNQEMMEKLMKERNTKKVEEEVQDEEEEEEDEEEDIQEL